MLSFTSFDPSDHLLHINFRAVPPAEKPKISGLKPTYRPGELVRSNCTSPNSFPAAKLEWKINGQPVYRGESILYNTLRTTSAQPDQTGPDKILETATIGLEFLISSQHFNTFGKVQVSSMIALFLFIPPSLHWFVCEILTLPTRPHHITMFWIDAMWWYNLKITP